MMIGPFASHSHGNEEDEDGGVKYGFAILGGFSASNEPELSHFAILPRVDISLYRCFGMELEGNFACFDIEEEKDFFLLGFNVNILVKPFQWGWGSLFILGGAGLGYDNSGGEVKEIGNSGVVGILQTGTGFDFNIWKGWILRGEYRYQHISDPFKGDVGFNTHNFIFGVFF
ncbi:MAG: outer membrane beta-barrel protein [Deltaproteobacteria bacterium]|nr:outer membrane beta-barrel protein [Deltaproteobacteria bacterium]